MADMLRELFDAVGINNRAIMDSSVAVKELVGKQLQANEEQMAAVAQSGKADQIIIEAETVAAQKAQRQTLEFANTIGSNPEASGEVLSMLAGDFKDAAVKASAAQKKLQDDNNISIFERPLDYLVAQIKMEDTVKDADIATNRRNNAAAALQQIQQATQNAPATANALKQTVTDATLQANLDKAAATITGQQAQLKIQNAGIQMQGIDSLMKMSTAQLNNLGTAFSAQNQAAQLQMARERMAMDQKEFALRVEQLTDAKNQKEENKKELEGLADYVRSGAAAMGHSNVTGLPTNKIIQLINMKNAPFMEYLNAGMKTVSVGSPVISEDAGTATRLVGEGVAPLRAEQAPIKNMLQLAWQRAANPENAVKGQYDATKKDQVQRAAGQLAISEAKRMATNIAPNDGSNIYAAPPMAAVVALPAIRATPFYKTILAPQMETGGLQEFNSKQLVGMTVQAVKDNKISFNEAAVGLQAMHTGAARINNATKNYVGMGLPNQNEFNVQIENEYRQPRNYNLAVPQDVNRLLMQQMKKDKTPGITLTPFGFN